MAFTLVSKRFYDAELGGDHGSLAVAKEFRDIVVEFLGLALPRGYRYQPHRSRDGFSYYEYWNQGKRRRFWVAGWQDDGRRRVQRFEVTADRPFYRARALAKEWRERMMAERRP